MSVMEKLLDSLLTLSSKQWPDDAYDRQITSIIQTLNKVGANHLVSNSANVEFLDILSPSHQSVGYLYVLLANIRLKFLSYAGLWQRTVEFLETYDARQIRYVPDQLKALVEEVLKFTAGQPLLVVRPLKKVILRSYDCSRFSFLHAIFVQKCLEAKCYRDATSVLDIGITEFPFGKKGITEVSNQDVLQYFLYGGMIYIGLKDWRKAADFLSFAVACPGNTCSTIQVEAYKKYLLVGLLLEGKSVSVPPGTTGPAARSYRALVKPYDGFIAAFKSGDAEVLRQQAAVCMPIFGQDGNAGLALQCMDAFRRFQIAALTHTYVTLSVGEIARRNLEVLGRGGGEEETEGYILGMVERDEIRASLSHEKPGPPDTESIVHFHNKPHSELRTLRALEKQILRTVAITNEAKAFEKKLGLSKEYIQHLNKLAKSGERHDTRSYIENDPMDTGADMFESFFPARSSTGFSYDDGGDDDMMHQDSFDDEP